MADKKVDKADPTITTASAAPEYPEGTHPARPASETTHSATNWEYRDVPDDLKPDPSSVVQEQVLQGDEATSK